MKLKASLIGCAAAVLVGSGVAAIADDATIQPPTTQPALHDKALDNCARNLRQIGQLIAIYTYEYRGQLAPDLGAAATTAATTVGDSHALFVCPSSGTTIPSDWASMSPDQKKQWINNKSDYVYLGREMHINQIPHASKVVLVYERGDNPHQGMMNLLFLDGHVESKNLVDAHRLIEASKAAFEK